MDRRNFGPFRPRISTRRPPQDSAGPHAQGLRRAGAVLRLRVPASAEAARPAPGAGPFPDRPGGGQPADLRFLPGVPGPHREPRHRQGPSRRPGRLPSLTTLATRIMPALEAPFWGEVIRRTVTGLESTNKRNFCGFPKAGCKPEIQPFQGGYPKSPAKWFRMKGLGWPESELP